jgi:hypothetical protein
MINVGLVWVCAIDDQPRQHPDQQAAAWIRRRRSGARSTDLDRRETIGAARVESTVNLWTSYATVGVVYGATPPAPSQSPPPMPILTEGRDLIPPFGADAIMSGSDVLIEWRGWPHRSMWCTMESSSGSVEIESIARGLPTNAPSSGKNRDSGSPRNRPAALAPVACVCS